MMKTITNIPNKITLPKLISVGIYLEDPKITTHFQIIMTNVTMTRIIIKVKKTITIIITMEMLYILTQIEIMIKIL